MALSWTVSGISESVEGKRVEERGGRVMPRWKGAVMIAGSGCSSGCSFGCRSSGDASKELSDSGGLSLACMMLS